MSNRTFDILEYLVGKYEIGHQSKEHDSIRFRISRPFRAQELDLAQVQVISCKGGQKRELKPIRLDAGREFVSLRLAPDTLPKDWLGSCEFAFRIQRREYRCFPDMAPQ